MVVVEQPPLLDRMLNHIIERTVDKVVDTATE